MYSICSNCNTPGHKSISCKNPIISIGIIAFCRDEMQTKFLMIRRRNSIGFMDFICGKYSVFHRKYILNLFTQMTVEERESILNTDFEVLWNSIWRDGIKKNTQYFNEEFIAKDKFMLLKSGVTLQPNHVFYDLKMLIEESYSITGWTEQEWGFPKGKRNFNEKDLDCGLREFTEETGIPHRYLRPIENLFPFEEIFTGSNYKSYKHKYYLMEMPIQYIHTFKNDEYDKFEVSKIEWKSLDDCIKCIRPYNLEKIKLIEKINTCLKSMIIVHS